jgi:hypothetical protein
MNNSKCGLIEQSKKNRNDDISLNNNFFFVTVNIEFFNDLS